VEENLRTFLAIVAYQYEAQKNRLERTTKEKKHEVHTKEQGRSIGIHAVDIARVVDF